MAYVAMNSVDYPDWVRCEVEFHSGDVVLPLDMILKTSEYFLNAYPCFKDLFDRPECEQCKVQYIKRASKIAIDTALTTLKHQFGKYIGFFDLWFDDSKIALKAMSSDVIKSHQMTTCSINQCVNTPIFLHGYLIDKIFLCLFMQT